MQIVYQWDDLRVMSKPIVLEIKKNVDFLSDEFAQSGKC